MCLLLVSGCGNEVILLLLLLIRCVFLVSRFSMVLCWLFCMVCMNFFSSRVWVLCVMGLEVVCMVGWVKLLVFCCVSCLWV